MRSAASLAPDAGPEIVAADAAGVARAAEIVRRGELVGMPTETVYGLAGLATSDAAAAEIYAVKGRPAFNPLIAHFADAEMAAREVVFDAPALLLIARFWPGPLTLVAPVAPDCHIGLLPRSGLDTLAVRVPASSVARALISAVGAPLVAPSANRSGRVSPTTAAHVRDDLAGRIALVLDGGACGLGLESTIVACLGGTPRLLRPGAVPREAIEAALDLALADAGATAPLAPGALASHYAPRARVTLAARRVPSGAAALDFAGALGAGLDLSPRGDLREAAANLFAHLRALDASGVDEIVVAPIPQEGLGAAINDRLRRAARRDREPSVGEPLSWDEFRIVKAIADAQSLSGAAEKLGVNHSTLFRRLASTEAQLGVKLFERERSGYRPTVAGQDMVTLATLMGETISEFERRVAGDDVTLSGRVRVTTVQSLGVLMLPRICADLSRRHPTLRLDLVLSDSLLDLTHGEAEIALRCLHHPPSPQLESRRIAPLPWAVYATEELATVAEGKRDRRPWIAPAENFGPLQGKIWLDRYVELGRRAATASNDTAMAELAARGVGLALLPCFVGAAFASLRRVGGPVAELDGSLFVVAAPNALRTPRVRATYEFLCDELQRRRDWFAGDAVVSA